MAHEVPGFVYTMRSSGDIRQYRAVIIDGAAVVEVTQGDEVIDGVAQMPAESTNPEAIRIMKDGITFAVAGDTISAGDKVITDDQGRFVPASYADDNIAGTALSGGAVGEEIAVLLR